MQAPVVRWDANSVSRRRHDYDPSIARLHRIRQLGVSKRGHDGHRPRISKGRDAKQATAPAEQRASYLKEKVADCTDADTSLDHKILSTVREQAEEGGLKDETSEIAY